MLIQLDCFQKHGLEKLEAHPLLVSLNGGRLDSEVCAAPEDDYTSLNIKRAVASLFQANTNEDGGSNNEVIIFFFFLNVKISSETTALWG